ncbi:hypothetical protein [Fodinibius salsisoli]|uniref:Divergent polysaccharide deacetylase n=1 Tax=Fodinibius salsisoli TaxID=2820877 RepID=A0ABT3PSM6_9BACT|nr:hypothetical protein [Fodinibius salsisoli]MCW9708864.1 hypothetical protein [Fodinibius salsisoli]
MKEQKKKRFIALLLLAACLLSGYMLFQTSDGATRHLQSFAEADSLIELELSNFSISKHQIERTSVSLDSSFNRKIYRVDLPEGFSKTQLHAELNQVFHPYGIAMPAKVTFPEQEMQIHLEYKQTVIRTVELRTDADLTLQRNRASIIIAFNELPDVDLLNVISNFGEPIPVVLGVNHPMEANEIRKSLSGRYNRFLFWLQTEDNKDLIRNNPTAALRRMKQFEDILPQADILLANQGRESNNSIVSETNLSFVKVENALRLHQELGKAAFLEELETLKSDPSFPVAIITGNETTLSWLEQKLPDLKKAGVQIIPPPKTTF